LANTSPPVTPNTFSSNEASRRPSGVISPEELKYRFEAAISRSKRMYEAGLPMIAKKAHEEAIQHRKEMQSTDEDVIATSVSVSIQMEISYIRIIKACVPHVKSYEALAWERLSNLIESLLEESGLDVNPEFCNEQEQVGTLCAELRDREEAIKLLRLSLNTYLSDPSNNEDKIQRTSMLICEQYECLGQWDNLDAFKRILSRRLLYDPTSEPNALAKTINWCHKNDFQAAEIDGRLSLPDEYLVNGTLLHKAAADMVIQPEVIHQLVLTVYHATPDINGDTPLLVAVQHSNNTVLRALLRVTSSVHVWDSKGRTPLHRCDNVGTMELLLEEIKKPVHHSPSTELGLKLVHIDSTDAYGRTALHEACDGGNESMVSLLLHEGADVNLVSGLNETPLMLACAPNEYKGRKKLSRDRRRILEMLVNRNADTTYKDDRGNLAVTKSLKIRGYSDADIERMLSPDPRRRFTGNLGHGRNSDSTVGESERSSSVALSTSSSPVELAGDIPTRSYELDTSPPHSNRNIPTHDTWSNLQLVELEGSVSGATAVEANYGTVNGTAEPSNQKFLVTGTMKSIRRKMRIRRG
jgi:ankyrin repeat protein